MSGLKTYDTLLIFIPFDVMLLVLNFVHIVTDKFYRSLLQVKLI